MRWLILIAAVASTAWVAVNWKKSLPGESCVASFACTDGFECIDRKCASTQSHDPPAVEHQLDYTPMAPPGHLGARARDPSGAIGRQLQQNLQR